MIAIATLVIMFAAVYANYRNGLFTSVAMLMMVLLSGLFAFGFWEPIADVLDLAFQQNLRVISGGEDFLVLAILFCLSLFLLRLGYSYLAPDMIDEHGALQHFGGGAIGLIVGYFVAGFLICAMQTLPLDERFLDFEPRVESEPGYRAFYPPDRVWLALMRHASAMPFSWKEDKNEGGPEMFDRDATFELRYLRYRRSTESRPPMQYHGEFDRELGKQKPR